MKQIILFNQVTGPLFIDIVNAFASKYDNVILVTGIVEPTYAEIDVKVKIVFKATYKRHRVHQRIFTWILFFVQSFLFLLFRKGNIKALFVSNPPLLPFLGSIFSKRNNFKYDILIYDIFPDALSNFGYISNKSILFNTWDKLNKKTFKYAGTIFTISEVMKKVISRNVSNEKIVVVYPWVDTSYIKPIEKSKNWFIKKHNLIDKKIVLYSGNLGLTHDLITILKVANKMKTHDKNFHFLFIGDGVQKEALINYSKENDLTNVTFLPFQNAEILPFSFSAADFGIVSLGKGAENLSVPSKTFYQLAAGNIIIGITEDNSELSRIIKQYKCGQIFKPGNIEDLFLFLSVTSGETLELMSKNSRKTSLLFSPDNAYDFFY